MRIRSSSSHENGFHTRLHFQICLESFLHGHGEASEVELVGAGRIIDEAVDFGEGMFGDDVDGLESVGESRACGKGTEEKNEKDEAVLAAVVGEGEFFETGKTSQ